MRRTGLRPDPAIVGHLRRIAIKKSVTFTKFSHEPWRILRGQPPRLGNRAGEKSSPIATAPEVSVYDAPQAVKVEFDIVFA
ncbi:MAG: hypothetical protein JO139_04750 [Alphaproteobacteria bacterium]|nr:hypothetical protein [Alphaproteobacteria bacterium]